MQFFNEFITSHRQKLFLDGFTIIKKNISNLDNFLNKVNNENNLDNFENQKQNGAIPSNLRCSSRIKNFF